VPRTIDLSHFIMADFPAKGLGQSQSSLTLETLPPEMQFEIFKHVSLGDLAKIACSFALLSHIAETELYQRDMRQAKYKGSRALVYAARKNNVPLVYKIFDYGGARALNYHFHCKAQVTFTNVTGEQRGRSLSSLTPLHWAASEGNDAVVTLFLDHGALINQPNMFQILRNGNDELWSVTALSTAVSRKNVSTAHILLNKGAQWHPVCIRQNAKITPERLRLREIPAMISVDRYWLLKTAVQRNLQSVLGSLLSLAGPIDEATMPYGYCTLLNTATQTAGSIDLIPQLLSSGATVARSGMNLESPLHNLARLQDQDAALKGLRYLSSLPGFSCNILNNSGLTPLAVASYLLHRRMILALLSLGANPNLGHGNRPWPPLRRLTLRVALLANGGDLVNERLIIDCMVPLYRAGAVFDADCINNLMIASRLHLYTHVAFSEMARQMRMSMQNQQGS
jgi:ankyrin repeat protein